MNTPRRLLTTFAVAQALLAVPYSTHALADNTRLPRSLDPAVMVHFADLNLTTPAGISALYARLEDAAQRVCGPSFSLWDPGAYRDWKKCYRTTVDHAVRQINVPLLTALHQRTVRPLEVASTGSSSTRIR